MPEDPANSGLQASVQAVDSTADLILRAGAGEALAEGLLFQRYQPVLRRLAHGRLPANVRDLKDTDDLVQETLVIAFRHLGRFEYRREGAFLAYLRQILLNQIRQEIRRRKVRPGSEPLTDGHPDRGRTPAEVTSWMETLERYDQALKELGEDQREAVIMRIELGYTYEEIALALGRPSANAVRMLVARGLARLAKTMASAHGTDGVLE